MQKMFTLIRQGNLDEVKKIIEKKPEEVNCISGPKPKKDHAQSPLQVAFKIGSFDIAEYLIEHGADINFMEAEDEDSGLRAPVLFDAINAAITSLCYKRFDVSEKAMEYVKRLIKLGADVNKRASNGYDAINWAVCQAELIMEHPTLYTESQEAVRKQLARILDLLIENGADYTAWANRGHYAEPHPGPTNRSIYLDSSALETPCKPEMSKFLQEYFGSRCLQI